MEETEKTLSVETEPTFKIELPKVGDELALAPMHIQAWKETYVVPESGLTEEKVDVLLQHLLTNTEFRKNTITEALTNPDKVFYRVVKNQNGDVVGFIHGSKHEDHTELDAVYLLNEAKGAGVGGKLMEEFLAWADKDKPCRLEAFVFNTSAIGFYSRYGFQKTDTEMPLFRGMPVLEMVKPVEEESEVR
jgi:ribosomal protein S18 acetylase RimI-like enzyme